MSYYSPTRLPADQRPAPEISPLSERELEIRRKLKTNFEHYARKCLRIKTKEGRLDPLELNDAQRFVHARLEEQLEKHGRIRALILKGRQQGISTYTEGRFYWKVTHRKGVRAFILTHEDPATQNLFDMTDRYHKMCPDLVRPHTGAANAKELYFDKLDSGYKVGTAGTKAVGRSSTVQYFHGSEVAFWPHADTHMAGVMQAIPDMEGTEVILESTANGMGGQFYQMWQDAEAGIGDYQAIFVPWFWQKEYARTAAGLEFTPEELDLQKAYDLTDEQLSWRRAKIHELKSEALFRQEYPCLVGSTRVGTSRGIVPISEITGGVSGSRGDIVSGWSSGIKPVFEVTTSLGYKITATGNHPIAAADGSFVPVDDVLGREIILQPPRFADVACEQRMELEPCVEAKIPVTPEMGRFLGYFSGDGSWSGGTLSVVCDSRDEDTIKDVSDLLQDLFRKPQQRQVGSKKGGTEIRLHMNGAGKILDALGVTRRTADGATKREVCVPEAIWRSPQPVVKEFLRGLFEADGFNGYGTPRVVLFSRYKEFLQDVQVLLLGFGVTCALRSAPRKNGTGYEYTANELVLRASEARAFNERIGFVSARKREKTRTWAEPGKGRKAAPMVLADTVVSVTAAGDAEVFDLEVADTHVFDANGILVHNCDPSEAFIMSGRCVFDPVHLTRIKAGVLNPLSRHEVRYGVLRDHSEGELRVWEHPQPGARYAVGADVAEGLAHGDFSCADVLEVPSGKQVAQWHGHVAPDQFGEVLVALAKHYNHAKLAVERNNHGHTTLTKILDLEYDNIYVQSEEIRDGANSKSAKVGWTTSVKTKFQVLDDFVAEVRDGTHGICCEDTLREMRTFIVDDRGRYVAAENCHDDRVMSRAIAGEACRKFARELTHDTSVARTPRKVTGIIYG